MIVKLIEVTNNNQNWGKFLLARPGAEEFAHVSQISHPRPLLASIGWNPEAIIVFDLQTGEGAAFCPHGNASYDLNEKHRIWVCPMFEPFLSWLYKQDLTDLTRLPETVNLPDAEFELYGHRRTGRATKD